MRRPRERLQAQFLLDVTGPGGSKEGSVWPSFFYGRFFYSCALYVSVFCGFLVTVARYQRFIGSSGKYCVAMFSKSSVLAQVIFTLVSS